MIYEVWDVRTGNLCYPCETEQDAAEFVRDQAAVDPGAAKYLFAIICPDGVDDESALLETIDGTELLAKLEPVDRTRFAGGYTQPVGREKRGGRP